MVDCEVDGTLTVTPAQSVDNTKTTPSTSSNTASSTTANMTSPNAKMSATNTSSTTTTTLHLQELYSSIIRIVSIVPLSVTRIPATGAQAAV